MNTLCQQCNNKFTKLGDYLICEKCKIAIPVELEIIINQLKNMDDFRIQIRERLHILKQKKISNPNELNSREKEELDIWNEHNSLYNDLKHWLKQNKTTFDIRLEIIYPLIYKYIKVIEKIKSFY